MKILVNVEPSDGGHRQFIRHLLSSRGCEVHFHQKPLGRRALMTEAAINGCQGILVCNKATLQGLVACPVKVRTLFNFRGSRILLPLSELPNAPTIPCVIINPLWHTTKTPQGTFLFNADVDKLYFKGVPTPKIGGTMVSDVKQLPALLQTIKDSVLVACDIETTGLDLDKFYNRKLGKELFASGVVEVRPIYITSIAYSCLKTDGTIVNFALPFVNYDEEYWESDADFASVILFLRLSVSFKHVPFVFHNGLYDIVHLTQYQAFVANWLWDTMGAQHAWYAELDKNLGFTTSICCPDFIQWKFEIHSKDLVTFLHYNMKDTYWTLRVAMHQIKHMPTWAKANYYKGFKVIASCLYAALEGMEVDNEVRLATLAIREPIKEAAFQSLDKMTGLNDFNPGSWQQKEELFYTILGAKKPMKGKSKSCTDEVNLAALAEQNPLYGRYTDAIKEYQSQTKAISTYFKYRQRNGKLLFALTPFNTDTGRMACSASSFNCGTQVQNIPSYGKKQLVCKEGWVWVNIDYSKVEAVLTAYMANCPALIKAVTDTEFDFYRTLGTMFFGIPYNEVTTRFRNKVLKKIVHGTNYMMGAATFIDQVGIGELLAGAKILGYTIKNYTDRLRKIYTMRDFAQSLLDAYHDRFPEIKVFYADTKLQIMKKAALTSPTGYTRLFFGDISTNYQVLLSGVAHRPQGWAAEAMKTAVHKIWDEVLTQPEWRQDARFKAQVHDSHISIVKRKRLLEYIGVIAPMMIVPLTVNGHTITLNIDIEIGSRSYGNLTEIAYDRSTKQHVLPEVF